MRDNKISARTGAAAGHACMHACQDACRHARTSTHVRECGSMQACMCIVMHGACMAWWRRCTCILSINGVDCRPAAMHVRACMCDHTTRRTWLVATRSMHTHVDCMGGCACFWSSGQCFCSRNVFAAAANVFALCLLGERMFLLVFGPKFNEEVWLAVRRIVKHLDVDPMSFSGKADA